MRFAVIGGSVEFDQVQRRGLSGVLCLLTRLRHELRREMDTDAGRVIALERPTGEDGTAAGDVEQATAGGHAQHVDQAIELVEAGGVAEQMIAMGDVEVAPAVYRTRVRGERDQHCERAQGERGDPGETEKAGIGPTLGRKRDRF